MIKPLDEIHSYLRNNPLCNNTMFYKHSISLLFLIITANSFKLGENTGNELGQFSKSEDDEDSILLDKDDWKENSSEMLEELDENLEELLEEKLIEEGFDDNEVMKMANFVGKMAHRNTLTVWNGGPYGSWGYSKFCSTGAYAVGYNLKIESSQGGRGDDTALNGIKLYCEFPDGRRDKEITSKLGVWGDWHGRKSCSRGHFLTEFQLQVEGDQRSGDDTSANFVRLKCRDLSGYTYPFLLEMPPNEGLWGTFGPWSMSCPKGEAICGLTTKVEDSCGGRCDDTALNDVKFLCCD